MYAFESSNSIGYGHRQVRETCFEAWPIEVAGWEMIFKRKIRVNDFYLFLNGLIICYKFRYGRQTPSALVVERIISTKNFNLFKKL